MPPIVKTKYSIVAGRLFRPHCLGYETVTHESDGGEVPLCRLHTQGGWETQMKREKEKERQGRISSRVGHIFAFGAPPTVCRTPPFAAPCLPDRGRITWVFFSLMTAGSGVLK